MLFKEGDKIVCVDDSIILRMDGGYRESHLTNGKVYEIMSITPTDDERIQAVFYVDNDNGLRKGYSIKRFIPFIEYRKSKLLKLKEKINA